MSIHIDPEGRETRALFELVPSVAGLTVLEIGCGDGRLTARYAGAARHVLAIDPETERIARAADALPPRLREHVELRAGTIEQLVASPKSFDLAIFSWSL